MKLVTFQSFEALEYLNKFGYLICDDKYIEKSHEQHTAGY